MNRDKEISNAAKEYTIDYGYFNCNLGDVECGFEDGAKWADEHPINPWHSVKAGELPQAGKVCMFGYQGKLYKGFMYKDGALHFDDEFSPMLDINELDYWMEMPELPKKEEL